MKIFLVSQNENNDYDTYDSFVCYAKSKEQARNMLPSKFAKWGTSFSTWASSSNKVNVKYLGKTKKDVKAGVILASFNAG